MSVCMSEIYESCDWFLMCERVSEIKGVVTCSLHMSRRCE